MTQAAVIENAPTAPTAPRESWLARHPAWPVTLLLAGIPLWWALGIGDYIVILIAIPMAARIYAWSAQDNRRIRVPPGFALWMLFLVCALAGAATLSLTAPGTTASPVSNRMISFAIRTAGYLGVTVILLFAGNLTERELPRKRLAWLLGLVGLYAAFGGLLGVLFPRVRFTSPLAAIVPGRLLNGNKVLQAELHPALSQLQTILGPTPHGRPAAPFVYTNSWGNCLAILLPWLLAAWWFLGTRRQRLIAATGLVIAFVPAIYSLDRGLWLGLLVAVVYLGVRLAARGRIALLGALVAGLALAAVLIAATPLQGIISQRLANGASNDRRSSLAVSAIEDATASPIIGYGDTRHQQGSVQSVAVGRTATCGTCGNGTIGGNGQLWLLLVCSGFVGTALYLSFFAFGCWRYRRDTTPYGLAGVLVLLLSFVFMVAYNATGLPLCFTMLAYAILWRNDRARREQGKQVPRTRQAIPGSRPAAELPGPVTAPAGAATAALYARMPMTWPGTRAAAPGRMPAMRPDVPARPAGPRSGGPARGQRAGDAAGRDEHGQLAGLARGGAANLAGAVVAAATTLAVTVLVTRHYSQPVAGAFFTAISLFLIIEAVASLGAYVGAINFIARLRRLGHGDRIPVILRAAIIPVVIVSVLAAVVMFVLAEPLAHILLHGHLGHSGATPGMVADALRALALALPCAALADTLLGAARGYRDMRPTVVVDKIGRSSGQLIAVLIAVSAGSAALLAPLWAIPYLFSAAAGWYWLRRIRRSQQARNVRQPPAPGPSSRGGNLAFRADGSIIRSAGTGVASATFGGFWRFTAPRALANLVQITLQRIDIVLVAVMCGPAEAAIYTAATRFLVAGQFGNTSIIMAAQPRFAELFAVGNRRGAGQVYQVTTAWLIVMTWPLYLLAVIYGQEVLSLFGHSYQAGHAVMIILGLTMLLAAACGQVDTVLITAGRSGWSLANGLMALIVNVGLDVLLIPRYGITGAAIGWSAAIVVSNLTPLGQLAFKYGLHPFGRGALTAAALSVLSFAVIPLVALAVFGPGPAVSIGAVVAGCCVQAAGLWWFRDSLQLAAIPGLGRLCRKSPAPGPSRHDHITRISRLTRGRVMPTGSPTDQG
jgi:O-antigen/teichoic acid export membrane protein